MPTALRNRRYRPNRSKLDHDAAARDAIARHRAGDSRALDELVPLYARYAREIAVTVARHDGQAHDAHLIDDLVQEALIGLHRAAMKFDLARRDPETGQPIRFLTYATYWMMQAVKRALPRHTLVRLPAHIHPVSGRRATDRMHAEQARRAHALRARGGKPDSDVYDAIREMAAPATSDGLEPDERAALARAVAGLDPRERCVIERLYGDRPATLDDIGRELGCSRTWVRKIESQALAKLAEVLAP